MLEETLSSPTYSPAEAALTLISFVEVELAAGGASAEARFFTLFAMLCDRVFGPIDDANPNKEYRHQMGGWLSRHVRWERPRQTQATTKPNPYHNHHGRRPVPSVSSDPVVLLLGARSVVTKKSHSNQATALTLVEAMAKEAEHRPNVRYPFQFKALPELTQKAWLALLERAIVEEVNAQATAFGGRVSTGTPTSQGAAYPSSTPQPMMMSPMFPHTPSTPTMTTTAATAATTVTTTTANTTAPTVTNVSENAERLLGSVFRVKPKEQNQLRAYQQSIRQKKNNATTRPLQLSPIMYHNQNSLRSPSLSHLKDKEKDASKPKIMLSMLEYYLVLFLRYPLAAPIASAAAENDKPPVARRSEAYGDSVYYQLFYEYIQYYVQVQPAPQGHSNTTGFASMTRPTELFLRICLAFWLEGRNPLEARDKSIKHLKERKGILDPDFVFDLNFSYDLIKQVSSYSAPPFQIQRCFHKLVARAVSDGALADAIRDTSVGLYYPETLMPLSPVLKMMQLPFYNYVRTAFRHASIHARQSPFYTALSDWLVWLEPWNTKYGKCKNITAKFVLWKDFINQSECVS